MVKILGSCDFEHMLRNRLQDFNLNGRFHFFDETTSTNDIAKDMIVNDLAHGTIIVANSQVKGRGTIGRSFFSKQGTGIYMSLIIDSREWHFTRLDLATIFTVVAVSEAIIQTTKKPLGIKWVNDLFLDGLKIGGILTETTFDSHMLVIGIGLNVSTKKEDFPKTLQGVAGSLGIDDNSDEVKVMIIMEIIRKMLFSSRLSDFKECLRLYRLRSLILDQIVEVKIGNDFFEGYALDINDYGQLVVRKESGEIVILNCGEASIKV